MARANQERVLLERLFRVAVAAVEPGRLVGERLRTLRLGAARVWLIAAGKAAPAMAREAVRRLGPAIAGGVVVAPHRLRGLPATVRAFVGGHPLPNRASLAAGRFAWKLLGAVRRDDVVLVLLSGGASSLLVLPAAGISLRDKIRTTELLLRAGASIGEVNAVRKHVSRLKGGGLARRAGKARVICLALSDVIGGSPAVIGSGPAATDPTTYADALRALERHEILERVPTRIRRHLERGRDGRLPETLKPGELRTRNLVIGDNRLALEAAWAEARSLGIDCEILTASLRGDTRRSARRFGSVLRSRGLTLRRSRCVLAGGETTVDVHGGGRGGRNQEFALALVEDLRGLGSVQCLSAGSDGRDGPTDAAGAFVDGTSSERAARRGLEPADVLARNDSYAFFRALGDLFVTGPTGTNVMDLKIAILRPSRRGKGV